MGMGRRLLKEKQGKALPGVSTANSLNSFFTWQGRLIVKPKFDMHTFAVLVGMAGRIFTEAWAQVSLYMPIAESYLGADEALIHLFIITTLFFTNTQTV
jgi:hypothetical protein